jgi:peptidoglycan/LPS O-acetylase OafA/YrhL
MALVTSRTGFVKLYDGWSVSNVIAWLVASLGLAALSYLLVERTGMKIAAKLDEGARLAPRSRSDVLASGGNIKRSPSISPMAKLTIE